MKVCWQNGPRKRSVNKLKKCQTVTLVLLIGLSASCSRQSSIDSSTLVVTPGVGIHGLLELGMTPRQIQRQTPDLVIERLKHVGTFVCHVPSLGAQWEQEHETDSLYKVDFLTNPDVFPAGRATNWGRRFQGTIAGGLSFRSNNSVDRAKVVAVFGEPSVTYDFRAGLPAKVPPALMNASWITNTVALEILIDANAEVMAYPKEGVGFGLDHGVVYTFSIYPKAR